MDTSTTGTDQLCGHLLDQINSRANDQGVWQSVAKKEREATTALQAARTRYLEQALLLQGVEDLLLDVNTLLGHEDPTSSSTAAGAASSHDSGSADSGSDDRQAADAALLEAGFQCGVDTYMSLNRHLQAAQALQRLSFPLQHQQPADASEASTAQHNGTLVEVLGVSALTLKQQHLPSKKRAQRHHAGVLNELEQRLCDTTNTLVRQLMAIAGTHATQPSTSSPTAALSPTSPSLPATAAPAASPAVAAEAHPSAHVLQLVASRCAAVEAAERSNAELLQQHVEEAGAYLGRLHDMQRLLVELVEGCMLDKQRRMDKVHCDWLTTHVRTLFSKLHVLEGQFQASAYTKDTMPALRTIHDLLERQGANTQASLDRVSAQLLAYEECGPDFMTLVAEYASVKDEMRRVEHALHKFSELEQELET